MPEDLRLSVSKTKTFLSCKAQYKFNYILRLPKKDHDYHVFGKFNHLALEYFHQQYINGCLLPYHTTMTDAFKFAWAEYKDKMTPEMKKECRDILDQYLRIITKNKENGKPFNVLAVEKRFEFALTPNLLLNGAIDIIKLDDDNVLHVADWKTTKNKKYLMQDWLQMLTYGFIILNENPDIEKIRASYVLLRHDFEYITREFSIDELLAVKQQYIDYAEKILAEKEFAPNPTILCNYCDFLGSCESGLKQTRMFNGEVEW